jgi:hypothetical protein
VVVACLVLLLSTASAGARPATNPTPGEQTSAAPAALNSLIDTGMLEKLQSSVVGLVTVWEEPEDPWAMFTLGPLPEPDPKAISICTGWFDTPSTIVTAGHCMDPAEGRLELDAQTITIDSATGDLVPPPLGRPEPKRTVWAFQPRELPNAVITAPTIVRVDDLRPATEGDTAKLDVFGLPPAASIPVAARTPQLGEPVWSLGFPGLNISATDDININDLFDAEEGKDFAEALRESRIQPVSTSGSITSRQFRGGVAVYQTNADLASGTSGGPTINSRGEAYGINSQRTLSFFGQNYNIITDAGMLREFLGHEDTDAPDVPSESPSNAAAPAPTQVPPAPGNGGINPPSGGLPIGWVIAVSAAGGAILSSAATALRRRTGQSGAAPEKPRPPRHRATRDNPTDTPTE